MTTTAYLPITIRMAAPGVARGSGDVELSLTGVDPGSFARNPALLATNSLVPVLFWSVPFNMLEAGDVFVLMDAISFMQNANGPATVMGVLFTADVDGNPVPDTGVKELNINGATINTWTTDATLQSLVTGLAAGPHLINFYMQVFDANCTAQTAAGEASVEISRA